MAEVKDQKTSTKQEDPRRMTTRELKEKRFVLDCTNLERRKLKEYDPLKDKHMENYFIYFNNSCKSECKKKMLKTARLKLPAIPGTQTMGHQEFQKYLDQKALQTRRAVERRE